jgi:hypothetical protein
MDSRQEIITSLRDAGMFAIARDWALGATILAGTRQVSDEDTPEIKLIENYICLVPTGAGRWRIDVNGVKGEVCATAHEAIIRTIKILRLNSVERETLIKKNYELIKSERPDV